MGAVAEREGTKLCNGHVCMHASLRCMCVASVCKGLVLVCVSANRSCQRIEKPAEICVYLCKLIMRFAFPRTLFACEPVLCTFLRTCGVCHAGGQI